MRATVHFIELSAAQLLALAFLAVLIPTGAMKGRIGMNATIL
jgi:hypothetical protein